VRIHMQISCTRTRVLTFQFTTINTFSETAVCKLVPDCNSYRTCRMLCISWCEMSLCGFDGFTEIITSWW